MIEDNNHKPVSRKVQLSYVLPPEANSLPLIPNIGLKLQSYQISNYRFKIIFMMKVQIWYGLTVNIFGKHI